MTDIANMTTGEGSCKPKCCTSNNKYDYHRCIS